ncbi:MAG: helix-turn-helix domain-containing protein [Acidobacteriota bacterium]|nr:helix-turn-helix domain-containing protein [Acidobacteriota bacterium]
MDGDSPTGKKNRPARKVRTRSDGATSDRPAGFSATDPAGRSIAAQEAVGAFLRSARQSQKLTQEQVAAMTKDGPWQLSRAAISAIERGQNFPGMEAMLALSNVLFVDPKQLVERARLATEVPIDATDIDFADLNQQAADAFWTGDFRKAISIYDAMLEILALQKDDADEPLAHRIAAVEVKRATALKRAGALLSAIATAEKAISLSSGNKRIQAEAYIALSDLQCQRGLLPLAGDAARRAIELSEESGPQTKGWAWMVRARVQYISEEFEESRQSFLEARKQARAAGDTSHMTHIEGDIGMCWLGMGRTDEARKWVRRAVDLAREHSQPSLEASWLVALGKIAFQSTAFDEAESFANAAMRISKPRELQLTTFQAEWLCHCIARKRSPDLPDRHRLAYLRKLYLHLDQHEGVEEVREFRAIALRTITASESGLET